MPELRQDLLSGRWVIVAENRAARPDQFVGSQQAGETAAEPCPFCPGCEGLTPEATAIYPEEADPPAWHVRVVPNKFPAVEMSASGDRGEAATGVHEVIIESPRHVTSLSEVSEEEAYLSFLAYRDRLRHFSNDLRLAYGFVFKNVGAEGGASLAHTHSQLLVTSRIPPEIQLELARAGEHRLLHASCAFCDLVEGEFDGDRHVAATEHFFAFCPFAARFPFEIWILPRQHSQSYEDTAHAELRELAAFMQNLIRRLEVCLDSPAYNYWIRNAPFSLSRHDDYHWRIELTPRMTRLAGFELGTGCFINPVGPEQAAARLREVTSLTRSVT